MLWQRQHRGSPGDGVKIGRRQLDVCQYQLLCMHLWTRLILFKRLVFLQVPTLKYDNKYIPDSTMIIKFLDRLGKLRFRHTPLIVIYMTDHCPFMNCADQTALLTPLLMTCRWSAHVSRHQHAERQTHWRIFGTLPTRLHWTDNVWLPTLSWTSGRHPNTGRHAQQNCW